MLLKDVVFLLSQLHYHVDSELSMPIVNIYEIDEYGTDLTSL
jgi:hypothetical protein